MRARALWLIVTAVLFAAWLGWLTYLAATTARPIVLSRAQLLVSTIDLIADVPEKGGRPADKVTVVEVHWPTGAPEQRLVGKTIRVVNLPDCEFKWTGPGRYILPLVKEGDDLRVAAIPPSPGFDTDMQGQQARIYPVLPQTLEQLETIHKPSRP
jgi:hypothetical protein